MRSFGMSPREEIASPGAKINQGEPICKIRASCLQGTVIATRFGVGDLEP
jgi:hypothetical protein